MTDGIPVRNLETTRHGKGRLGIMSLPLEIKRILSRNPSRRLVGPRLFGTNLRPTRLLRKIILQSMRVQVQRTILLLRTTERTTRRTQSHLRELTHRSLDLTLDQAARVALEHILLTLMVSQFISTLTEAIKKAWNWFKSLLGAGSKGGGVLAKIGQSFGTFFSHITDSTVWKGIKNSGLAMWIKKWGPKIAKWGGWIATKLERKIFWVFLLLDVKDMISVELCLIKVMEMQSDNDLSSYCDDPYTKLTVGWAVEYMDWYVRKHPEYRPE
jgi:hypothetical protein